MLLLKMILRHISLSMVKHIPWTQGMCEKAVENEPDTLKFVPDDLKIQRMCERAIEEGSYNLKFVPDHLKTQDMCDKVVKDDYSSLQYVPCWFVTRK